MSRFLGSIIIILSFVVACTPNENSGGQAPTPAVSGTDPVQDESGNTEDNTDVPSDPNSLTSDCETTDCSSKKEFCLKELEAGGQTRSAKCVVRPPDCRGCDCLTDYVRDLLPSAKAVGAWLDCPVPKDGKYSVICFLP